MMHRARSSIVEVPYCFSRLSVKFQGHRALKIVKFDPKWAFPDCNSSLNSAMAMKCCTKLETAKERCPIIFQGHQSNFKVTRYKASPILTQIGRFRTKGQSQLSNPSDLPCFKMCWSKSDLYSTIVFAVAYGIVWCIAWFRFYNDTWLNDTNRSSDTVIILCKQILIQWNMIDSMMTDNLSMILEAYHIIC